MTRRFRRHAAITVAAIIALIGAVPVAIQGWLYAPVLLVPLAVAIWAWRSGTDVDESGLTVRALLGRRRIPWAEVTALVPDGRGGVQAVLGDRAVPLTAVRAVDMALVTQYAPTTSLSNGSPAA